MNIVWHGRNGRTETELPKTAPQDEGSTMRKERRFATWIDEIIARHEQAGGFAELAGKGKPLQLDGDQTFEAIVQRMFKDSDVVPEWVRLRREIVQDLRELAERQERHPDRPIDVAAVNDKIRRYNAICPSVMQRSPVALGTLRAQLEKWE